MKSQLLYAKSKVYIHPTKSSKDNIGGYFTITKPDAAATKSSFVISFIPEVTLNDTDRKVLDKTDLEVVENLKVTETSKRYIDPPRISSLTSYAFGISIANIYSVQLRSPSPGWWFGSLVIHSRDGEGIPILFFHDDESPSTKLEQKIKNKQFEPFAENEDGELFWGGDKVLSVLKQYCHLEKSTLEKSVYLVNPTLEDLRSFIPQNVIKQENTVGSFFSNAKWKVLEALASVTKGAKSTTQSIVDESPESVKKLLRKPEVRKINDEFDSARVYLAKWAADIENQANKSRKLIILDEHYQQMMSKELGQDYSTLTIQEVNNAARLKPLSLVEWENFFDNSGRLCVTMHEVLDRVFHGGVSNGVRIQVWPFLLGVYPWDSSFETRVQIDYQNKLTYERLKAQWSEESESDDEFWLDQKNRIDKDVRRTDRNIDMYSGSEDEMNGSLHTLRRMLLTFNQYNLNLGYVQGMNDLLSPLLFVLQDEAVTFWAFARFMDRMERNFLRDQSGMRLQLSTLNELVQFMLPEVYVHLEKCDSTHLFFFFRMLLVWFKREFSWDATMKLWEVLWTDYYSSQFHLFVCLAILDKHGRIIKENLTAFDQVLKYINDLSMSMDLDDILVRAELLFLKFRKMCNVVDRKGGDNKPLSKELRGLLSKELVIQKEVVRPSGVGGG